MISLSLDCHLSKRRKSLLCSKSSHVFSKSDSNLGLTNLIEHGIDLIDKTIIRYPDEAIAHHLLKEVQGIIQTWLNQGIIKIVAVHMPIR